LRSRWAGKSHHRLYQLQKERKTQFTIYYEIVPKSQIDAIEPYVTNQEAVEIIEDYELTQLAGVKIRSINDPSLAVIKNKCQLRVGGMYVYSNPQNQP
jgi:transposase